MPDALTHISTRRTLQTDKADPRQVANSAGGFVFEVSPLTRLRRFLTLGVTGGTYYVAEKDFAKDAATAVLDMARSDGEAMVEEIVAISTAGRAPKQNPALFALAAVSVLGNDEARKAAFDALPLVARTGTHLFIWAGYREQFGGWGRGARRAVGRWYSDKDADALAYQLVKYQQREGWSQRDLLRLAHPTAPTPGHKALYDWVCKRDGDALPLIPGENPRLPGIIRAYEQAHGFLTLEGSVRSARKGIEGKRVEEIVRENRSLSWEMLPSEALNDAHVWRALLDNGIPMTALLRQLPRLTRLGLCDPLSDTAGKVATQLTDPERLRKARVHPISVLIALRTYASGRSARGDGEWTPSRVIVDALDRAFYAAFGAVEPSGKRMLLALDVSGSMGSPVAGLPISCREASAALALVAASVESAYEIVGFTGDSYNRASTALTPLAISPRQRLDDAVRTVSNLSFGQTDCSMPMRWALEQGKQVDQFVVLTDNETYAGIEHPHQALQRYREKTGIPARLVVVGMTASPFTIADPSDAGELDCSGFDAATPGLISDFAQGKI